MDPGNKYNRIAFILAVILVLAGGFFVFQDQALAAAGINKQINFQGKVVNTDGTNVANGNYNFNFRIYTQQAPGGSVIWSELNKSLTVTDGIFQTNLGDATALPGSVDFNSDNIFLGIEFNGDGEMGTRIQFTAAPYAMNADKLAGKTWEAPGAIGSGTPNTGAFTTLGSNSTTTLSSTAGSTFTIGNSTGTGTIVSGGVSSWANTEGNLTISTATSGTLVLTSAGALNLTGAAASYFNTSAGDISFQVAGTGTIGTLQIGAGGAGSTTPDLLGLDVKSTTSDPAGGFEGVMYYNTYDNKFRCYQGSGWTDCISTGGAGPWTDGTGITYLTDTAEDFAVGGSALASPFSIDVSGNIVRIGDADTANDAYLDMYAADGDTGTIQYTANDSWYFNGGNVGINTTGPDRKLDILDASNPQLRLTYTDNSIYSDLQTGANGGLALTGSNLTVNGAIGFSNSFTIANATGSASQYGEKLVLTSTGATAATIYGKHISFVDATSTANTIYGLYVDASTANASDTQYAAAFMGGNVGIGTASPTKKLSVLGSIYLKSVPAPGACTAALAGVPGNVDNGTHRYKVTFVTADGETSLGTMSDDITVTDKTVNGQVNLTNIPTAPADQGVTQRKIYRTKADIFTWHLLTTIAGNTTTTYVDNTSDAGLGADDSGWRNNTTAWIYNDYGKALSLGYFNVIVGNNAFNSNFVGINNSVLGIEALNANTTGSDNSVVGTYALNHNTTGSYNSVVGDSAIFNNVIGESNTAVGYRAGYGTSGNSFSNNSLFGYWAGYALQTGSNNILLGYKAGDNLTTGANNLLIGYDIDAQSATASNQLSIGNLIFASGGFGTGTTVGAGNVGIGTASPGAKLHVQQTATATGALKGIIYTGAINTNQTLSTEIPSLTLTTAGRQWATGALATQREVLITAPTYSFVGASTITDAATLAIAGAPIKSTNATITNTHGLLIQAGAVSTATNSYGLTVNAQTGATNNYAAAFLGGNVGIGVTGPTAFLDIKAATTDAASLRIEASAAVNPSAPNIGDMWFNGTNLYFRKDGLTSQDLLATGGSGPWTDGTGITYLTDTAEDFAIGGSTLAASIFGIDENAGNFYFSYDQSANPTFLFEATDGDAGSFGFNTNDAFYFSDANVGIGTAAPAYKLDVVGTDTGIDAQTFAVRNTNNSATDAHASGKLETAGTGGGDPFMHFTVAGATDWTLGIDNSDSDKFKISPYYEVGGVADGITMDVSGNVGIGANAPSSLLQVGSKTNYGNATVYGDIIKKGIISQKAISGTINDVFIYDTTRDSDAGRWTNSRTAQGLSWYTETKDNTGAACVVASDDRCGQSAFPKKTVIVATNDAVYIFDADNNTMWMKFNQEGTYALGADAANNPSSVFALNGVVYVGTNGASSTGLYAIDFTQDKMYRYNTTDRNLGDKDILNRNSTVTYNAQSVAAVKFIGAASVRVNDVHGAVVSGSSSLLTNGGPLNGGTFICAATDGGVQVINLTSGITIPFGDANITDQYSACFVTKRARMYALNVTKQELNRFGDPATSNNNIDTSVIAPATGITTPYKTWDDSATAANAPNLFKAAQTINVKPDTLEVIERASAVDEKGDLIYVGHGGGLTEIHDLDTDASPTLGWSKFYSITGETGLMNGTPRGMFGFGEAAGATQAVDATVRDNVLAIKSGVTMGVNGVHGTAARFNGTSGYMCSDTDKNGACDQDTDFNPTSSTVSYSFEMWFRHNGAVSGTDTLVDRSGSSTVAGFIVTMNSSGQVVAVERDGTITDTLTSTQSFADSQWHHLEVTRDNGSSKFCMFIDGRLAVACDTSTTTSTLNGSTAMAIGASCSGTVTTCSTQANFWDGDIDDVYFDMGGATTADQLTQAQVRKKYLEGRAALARPSATFVDATTASSMTIGDSTAAWVPNSFVGEIVEITQGTGVGQTRRIVSNTSTVLTVNRAFTTVPDTTSDFEVMPEQLYGATNSVYGIGMADNTYLGETRRLYVGTNDGADGGGVTVFEGMGTASATEVYHSDANKIDDSGTDPTWTGSNYDNIQSIGSNGTSVAFGSIAAFWTETDMIDLQSVVDKLANNINSIRAEMVVDGITGTSSEIGGVGGADLAEYYSASEPLSAGDIVVTAGTSAASVAKSTEPYQETAIGVVSTAPGIVLGTQEENSYPIALVGRVPVNVSTENGLIQRGDEITSASLAGYGMRAIEAGRVVGVALESMDTNSLQECPVGSNLPSGTKCGQIMTFVNLVDFSGMSVADLMQEKNYDATQDNPISKIYSAMSSQDQTVADQNQPTAAQTAWANILQAANMLGFLQQLNDPAKSGFSLNSEILAKNINASGQVVSPLIVTDTLIAKNIKAENIEGLQFIQTGIQNVQNGVASNTNEVKSLGQQIADLQGMVKSLGDESSGLDTGAIKDFETRGGLIVGGPAEFRGPAVFKAMAEFIDKVIFRNNVEFAGQVMFNQDTAGYAIVKEGQDKVVVTFEKEYAVAPVVNASLSLQQIKNEEVRQASEDLLLISDVNFIITNVTEKGFEIKIGQKALSDIPFSWQAMAVKDAKTFAKDSAEPDNNNASASDNPENLSSPIEAISSAEASGEAIIPAPIEQTLTNENTVAPSDTSASGAETASAPATIPFESAAN